MKKIGLIYEITNNPYFGRKEEGKVNKFSEYVKPSEINEIAEAFASLGYQYEPIDSAEGLLNLKERAKEFLLFFNKSIGITGLERKIVVPALAQLYKLPMIGSSAYAMTLARHKYHSNVMLAGMGFNVPKSFYFENKNQIFDIKDYPIIVKPNMESDSLGISEKSICYSYMELLYTANFIFDNFKQPIILEEFIPGEEWKIAVIGNGNHTKAYGCVNTLKYGKSMCGTLQTRKDVLDDTLTYDKPENEILVQKAEKIAERIHKLMGLNDYSRIDFRLGEKGKLYCMEITTHPYLSNHNSSFICAAGQSLGSFSNIMRAIIETALYRYQIFGIKNKN